MSSPLVEQAVSRPEPLSDEPAALAETPSDGRPIRGIVIGSLLSAFLWAGLILTGAALIR